MFFKASSAHVRSVFSEDLWRHPLLPPRWYKVRWSVAVHKTFYSKTEFQPKYLETWPVKTKHQTSPRSSFWTVSIGPHYTLKHGNFSRRDSSVRRDVSSEKRKLTKVASHVSAFISSLSASSERWEPWRRRSLTMHPAVLQVFSESLQTLLTVWMKLHSVHCNI